MDIVTKQLYRNTSISDKHLNMTMNHNEKAKTAGVKKKETHPFSG